MTNQNMQIVIIKTLLILTFFLSNLTLSNHIILNVIIDYSKRFLKN